MNDTPGLNAGTRLPAVLGLAVAVTCAAVAYGGYSLFSTFMGYDDEGLFLVTTGLLLDGHGFYTQILWPYGPAQPALSQLLHGVLGIPLTHSAARTLTLLLWLALAAANGAVVYRLTRSAPWAITAAALAFIYTDTTVNEPGHPQAWIALATALVPLLGATVAAAGRRWQWLAIGLLAALVFNIKVNAGLFCLAAVAVVLCARLPAGRWQPALNMVTIIAAAVSPFVLMYPLLQQPACLAFATLTALATSAAAIAALLPRWQGRRGADTAAAFAAGFVMLNVAVLAYSSVMGASPGDVYGNLLTYARSQPAFYHFFRDYSTEQLALAGLSPCLALGLALSGNTALRHRLIVAGKTVFVALALFALVIDDQANAHAMLGWAGPWCWLCVMTPNTAAFSPGRQLLAGIAAWSPLLAYPVPGSQLYFGSFPILVAAVVCAADLARMPSLAAATLLRRALPWLAALATLTVMIMLADTARSRYQALQPLELPGTGALRLEPGRVRLYTRLAEALEDADVVLSTAGFNSLYLWSGAAMPAPVYLTHSLAFLPARDQQRIQRGLQEAHYPVVVVNRGWDRTEPASGVLAWIQDNFVAYRQIGRFELLRPRRQQGVPPPTPD